MTKAALKNYVSNFGYFFLVLALTYLGVGVFLLVLFYGVLPPVEAASPPIYDNLIAYFQSFADDFRFSALFDASFLRDFIQQTGQQLIGLDDQLIQRVLLRLALAFIAVIGLSKLAQTLARMLMRRKVRNENSLRGIVTFVTRTLFSVAFSILYAIIAYLWFFAVFLLPFVSIIVNSFQDLSTTWFIHFKNVKFKEIFNLKNAFKLIRSSLAIQMGTLTVIILIALLSIPVAVMLGIPLFAYNAAVLDVTSAKYFNEQLVQGELTMKAPPRADDL